MHLEERAVLSPYEENEMQQLAWTYGTSDWQEGLSAKGSVSLNQVS
jgi:hypothetical protein